MHRVQGVRERKGLQGQRYLPLRMDRITGMPLLCGRGLWLVGWKELTVRHAGLMMESCLWDFFFFLVNFI